MKNDDSRRSMGLIAMVSMVAIMFLMSSVPVTSFADEGTRQEDDTLILKVAMQDDMKTTNPLVSNDVWTSNVIMKCYDGTLNSYNDRLIPYVAVGTANLTTTADPDDYTWNDCTVGEFGFTPRTYWGANSLYGETTLFYDFGNVTWHDDTQMSVRDVLFSYHVQSQMPEWVSSLKCIMPDGGEGSAFQDQNHKLFIDLVWWEGKDDGSKTKEQGMYQSKKAGLKFQLQVPYADFHRNTLSAFMLPYHVWGMKAGNQQNDNMKIWLDAGYSKDDKVYSWDPTAATSWDNPDPVGSGSFEFISWTPGVSSKITTWRDHFYTSGYQYDIEDEDGEGLAKQPLIEAIVYKIYKTAEQAVLALKNRDVDYIAWSIPPTFVQELMNEKDISIKQTPEKGFFYMAYNMRRKSFGYDDSHVDVGKPFRKAVAYCIDKTTIVERLLQNFGIAGAGPVSSISDWFNESIQTYSFDPAEAKRILYRAGYHLQDGSHTLPEDQAIAAAGETNFWLNPDDTPIGSGSNGLIEIYTPQADYDPIRAQAGQMIAQQMKVIGINAQSVATDFGTIVEIVERRDFDMFILGWRIGSDPTDFLYAFFHSDTAEAGQNYPGYQNSSFDSIIDDARETGDEDLRMAYMKDAQAAIAYDLPYDVLYFRTNIEAFRSDRFVGWVAGSAGVIFNWESIVNLKPPSNKWLTARFVNMDSAVESNSTADAEILVTGVVKNPETGDLTRTPVANAEVSFEVTLGTLGDPTDNTMNYTGVTDTTGKIKVNFNAPYVPPTEENIENGEKVLFQILKASLEGYDDAPPKVTLMTAYPKGVPFLAVKMDADPDVVEDEDSAGTAGISTITITVNDQEGNPVSGATVLIEVDPPGPTLSPATAQSDGNGEATFTFTAEDIEEDKEYTLKVDAFKIPEFKNGTQSMFINVIDYEDEGTGTTETPFPSVLVIASVFSIMAIVYSIRRKRA